MSDIRAEEMKRRLRDDVSRERSAPGDLFEVWAEPLGNPAKVFYEGEPYPLSELDIVVGKILEALRGGEVRSRWVGKRDD